MPRMLWSINRMSARVSSSHRPRQTNLAEIHGALRAESLAAGLAGVRGLSFLVIVTVHGM